MLIYRQAIVGAGLLIATGCTTLSADAPAELHAAKTSLDKAYERDVDDRLPHTMDRANSTFKEGLKLYSDSESFQSDDQPALAKDARKESIDKANVSKKLSTSALALNDDLAAWDKDINMYTQVKSNADKTEELESQIAGMQQESSQDFVSDDFLIVKPVAFFMTDGSSIDKSVENDVETLAALMKRQKLLVVELTGFTDFRGSDQYNMNLGMQRAQAVAALLANQGIEPERIRLTSLGSDLAVNDTSDPARLQLDRRVEAKLTVLSH